MADIADFANDLVQERIDLALAARNAFKQTALAPSSMFCDACEEPIPEARRLASPGCTQCTGCQTLAEQLEARHAR
ncbi:MULTISPECIES: TraR/DksA family transcriptional regulator [unclassified Pseudomonas]|uniref:TraR/DksA family transcriptional regulator n=1 Tax=unclassified Pseudomonas TaxID=196821 RepID=UPI000CEE89DE|nr:TraR/DksA family transcriptional regulator [Pseudomonas sp. BRM28]PPS61794.1 conjugal transfer protein TraR [Pseudomonas sp. BRM28]